MWILNFKTFHAPFASRHGHTIDTIDVAMDDCVNLPSIFSLHFTCETLALFLCVCVCIPEVVEVTLYLFWFN